MTIDHGNTYVLAGDDADMGLTHAPRQTIGRTSTDTREIWPLLGNNNENWNMYDNFNGNESTRIRQKQDIITLA